jgi:hypothetical protein
MKAVIPWLLGLYALVPTAAQAALVPWNVSSAQSQLRLAIPDQSTVLDVQTVLLRIRNQTGGTTSWTTGNLASVGGTFLTDYQEGPAPSIEFLSGNVGEMVGIDSGSYRPSLATYDGGTVNPDGSASGGTFLGATAAPAVYGGRIRATITPLTVDAGLFSISDLSYGLASDPLAINPGTGTFAANGTQFGILSGLLGVDLQSVLLAAVLPDSITALPNSLSGNAAGVGTITSPDPINQPLLRQISLPISVAFQMDFGEVPMQATLSGTLVATAIVPEPASWALLGCGTIALVWHGRRRRHSPRKLQRAT